MTPNVGMGPGCARGTFHWWPNVRGELLVASLLGMTYNVRTITRVDHEEFHPPSRAIGTGRPGAADAVEPEARLALDDGHGAHRRERRACRPVVATKRVAEWRPRRRPALVRRRQRTGRAPLRRYEPGLAAARPVRDARGTRPRPEVARPLQTAGDLLHA